MAEADNYWWNRIYQDDINTSWGQQEPDKFLQGYINDLIARTPFKRLHILDIGCGNGRNSQIIQNNKRPDITYTGIDFSEHVINHCRNTFPGHLFFQHDITEPIPNLSSPFHILFDLGCFHAIPPDKRACYIKTINDAAAPDSYLIIGCWYKKDRERDIIAPSFSFFPHAPINEWFFNENDIAALFAPMFTFQKFELKLKEPYDLNDGFLYCILQKKS